MFRPLQGHFQVGVKTIKISENFSEVRVMVKVQDVCTELWPLSSLKVKVKILLKYKCKPKK